MPACALPRIASPSPIISRRLLCLCLCLSLDPAHALTSGREGGSGASSLLTTVWTARVQVLKPHQVEGVEWLFKAIHAGGGILADDPGLGKTLQVITVVEALIKAGI